VQLAHSRAGHRLVRGGPVTTNLKPGLIRVDLHVHSSASFDSKSDPELVAERSWRLGLEPVFLTDHDTTVAAVRLQVLSRRRIVVGEEITTTDGELIGLFLQRRIRAGLTARQTALEIKEQAGLVYLEHPYDQFRRHLSEEAIEDLADLIDIVEVFNARSDDKTNRRAEELCEILGAAPGAGSDAHTLRELGSVYVEMENFDSAEDFLANLRRARIVKGRPKFLLMAEAGLRHKIRRL
jgi:predicted metal-dependent phosphoesterase TrpH